MTTERQTARKSNAAGSAEACSGQVKCVIFDMDGTLTQTNQLIYDSFNDIARRYVGHTFSVPEITAMFGPPEEGALVRIVGKENLDRAMEEYLHFYRTHHSRLARIYPGIVDVLRFLKERRCVIALFTGKGRSTTGITLEEFDLTSYFDMVVTGNDVVNHKPAGEGIQKVLDAFSLSPKETLMVGDSVSDVKAAREAGVRIASVLWDSYGKEKVLQMGSDEVFHSMEEFSSWLRRNVCRPA